MTSAATFPRSRLAAVGDEIVEVEQVGPAGDVGATGTAFGEVLVEALEGEAEIAVIGKDEIPVSPRNHRAYEDVHHKVRVPKD